MDAAWQQARPLGIDLGGAGKRHERGERGVGKGEHPAERLKRDRLLHCQVDEKAERREFLERVIEVGLEIPGGGNAPIIEKRADDRRSRGRLGGVMIGIEVDRSENLVVFESCFAGGVSQVKIARHRLERVCGNAGELGAEMRRVVLSSKLAVAQMT